MNLQEWDFDLVLIYGYVAVSLPRLAKHHNAWNRIHGSQGYSWRPGSVSFGTIDADEYPPLTVVLQDAYLPPISTTRVIKVPFQVEDDGVVVSDPLTQDWRVPIPAGNYALYFAIEPFEASWKYSLTFISEEALPKAEIILADELLSPPDELLMEAELA